MSRTSPWLSDKPTPDVTQLTTLELLALWQNNRNSLISTMAAEEVMKRLFNEQKEKETKS